MKLTSPAFQENGLMLKEFTCDDGNFSPPLEWKDLPRKVQTLALIADDPDTPSGTFVHWVFFDLPHTVKGLDKGVPKTWVLENGAVQGVNDFGRLGYDGPCPPSGTHRYFFKLYALDLFLDLDDRKVTKDILIQAMKGHTLAEAYLVGTYRREGEERLPDIYRRISSRRHEGAYLPLA